MTLGEQILDTLASGSSTLLATTALTLRLLALALIVLLILIHVPIVLSQWLGLHDARGAPDKPHPRSVRHIPCRSVLGHRRERRPLAFLPVPRGRPGKAVFVGYLDASMVPGARIVLVAEHVVERNASQVLLGIIATGLEPVLEVPVCKQVLEFDGATIRLREQFAELILKLLEAIEPFATGRPVNLEEALNHAKEAVAHLGVRMASVEAEPDELLKDAKPHQEPVHHVCHHGKVVGAPICVPVQRLACAIVEPPVLVRAIQGHDEARQPEIAACPHMGGHDHETVDAPLPDDGVALDREIELVLRQILRVSPLWRDGHHEPMRAALVIALVARVPSETRSMILELQCECPVLLPVIHVGLEGIKCSIPPRLARPCCSHHVHVGLTEAFAIVAFWKVAVPSAPSDSDSGAVLRRWVLSLCEEPSAGEHLRLPGFIFQRTIARICNCGRRIMLAVQQVPRNPLELDGSFVWQPIMKGELIYPPSSSPGCPSSFDPFPFLEGAELHLCQLRALQTLRAEATSDEMNLRPMRKARAADCHHESATAHRVLP